MKRAISVILCLTLVGCIFAGCKANTEYKGKEKLDKDMPSESVNYDELTPIYDFEGTYKNDDYTAEVETVSDQILKVIITSNVENSKGYVWEITDYFSDQTYRINYTDSIKYAVTYDKNGGEAARETEYENGSGRIQFTEKGKLLWDDSLEKHDEAIEMKKAKN